MDNRARVLIVDDDELVCRALSRILRDTYDITLASKGEEALGILTDGERFDVILTDFAMPRMDGARLVELIGQLDRAQADRVIFITGNPLSATIQTDTTYLIVDKPFTPGKVRELVDRVSSAARRGYFPDRDDEILIPRSGA